MRRPSAESTFVMTCVTLAPRLLVISFVRSSICLTAVVLRLVGHDVQRGGRRVLLQLPFAEARVRGLRQGERDAAHGDGEAGGDHDCKVFTHVSGSKRRQYTSAHRR